MTLERIYFTVIYTCGHAAARPYLKDDPKVQMMLFLHPDGERLIYSPHPCVYCTQAEERYQERRKERAKWTKELQDEWSEKNSQMYYDVDGYRMKIYRDARCYWHGSYWVDGKRKYRNFGRTDPRLQLEVAQ